MGNRQSGEDAEACGYRVLGVQPNSPASKVGLVSFFDFIVAADGELRVVLTIAFTSCTSLYCTVLVMASEIYYT